MPSPAPLVSPDETAVVETLRDLNGLELVARAGQLAARFGATEVALYLAWLDLHGRDADALFAVWCQLGLQHGVDGDTDGQLFAYQKALAIKPDLHEVALGLGRYFELAGQPDVAVALWDKALQPDAARIALLNNAGRVLETQTRFDAAERKYTASLLADPLQPDVLHHRIGLRTQMCLWPVYDTLPGVTPAALRDATRALTLLALHDDSALLTRANRSWIAQHMPPAPDRLAGARLYGHETLRIGYVSSDFCEHPIAYLVAELFELHDRAHFEIYGYCSTRDDGSAIRQRVLRAFDHTVDIRAMSDEEAARTIRADEIDILIDLNGLTLHTRLGIMRWKPAPIQMIYLGYNGPVEMPELDHIIADAFVIPPDVAATYQPAPLYLPTCFQVNDSTLPLAAVPTREDLGLPADAFVFCSFSNTYKITEAMFEAWLEILTRADRSVLWLYVDNPYATANLRTRALRARIADDRIIFAGRVAPELYRSRLALADLFLDTHPYNAGTTASDALRVGLPLITMTGESFTSRMAGSLLKAMGLEDGIVSDMAAYIDLAVALATDTPRYRAFAARVTPDRWRRTLGDTPRVCRELEAAFRQVASDLGWSGAT